MLTVDIDSNSGFCAGVIRAIGKAEEFLKESDPVDTIKARNLEKYYQLCIVGERESKIVQEMKEDVDNFLKSQKELRS